MKVTLLQVDLFGEDDRKKFATSQELNSWLPSPGRGDLPLLPEALSLYGHSLQSLLGIGIPNSEAPDFE
jgi:hypothetical protein